MDIATKELSNRVANISLICSILVTCIHYRDYVLCGSGSGMIFWEYFPGPLLRVAVPFFFTVAGFWLAGHVGDKGWWWREPFKRVRTLLVPFLCLNVGWFLFTDPSWGIQPWISAVGLNRGEYPALPQLWFVLRLFFLVLIAPLFYFIIRRGRVWGYCLFLAAYVGIIGRAFYCGNVGADLLVIKIFKFIVPPVGCAGVILGMTFRIYGIPRINRLCGALALVCGYGVLLTSNLIAYRHCYGCCSAILSFYVGMPMFLIGLWHCATGREVCPWLTRNTFAIYILHFPCLYFAHWALEKSGWLSWTESALVTILVVLLAVGLSAGIAQVIKRNRILKAVLLGGR